MITVEDKNVQQEELYKRDCYSVRRPYEEKGLDVWVTEDHW